MKTMLVSEFKAKCLAVATLQPVEPHGGDKRLGGLKGRMTIRRNLVKIDTTRDWDMLR